MVFFNDCNVVINGDGILAQDASISSNNTLTDAKFLGQKNASHKITSGPITNKVSISYVPNFEADPVLDFLELYREDTTLFNPFVVSVAGISGSFYLQSCSLKLASNNNLQSNLNFTSFNALSGDITALTPTISTSIATKEHLNNSWTTIFQQDGAETSNNVFEFSYNSEFDFKPNYILGKMEPVSVSFFGSKEDISLNLDLYKNIDISGQLAENYLEDINVVDLKVLASSYSIFYDAFTKSIPITGMSVVDTKVDARLDDIVRVSIILSKEY